MAAKSRHYHRIDSGENLNGWSLILGLVKLYVLPDMGPRGWLN